LDHCFIFHPKIGQNQPNRKIAAASAFKLHLTKAYKFLFGVVALFIVGRSQVGLSLEKTLFYLLVFVWIAFKDYKLIIPVGAERRSI